MVRGWLKSFIVEKNNLNSFQAIITTEIIQVTETKSTKYLVLPPVASIAV